MKIGKTLYLVGIALIFLSGCTSKKNLVGSDWSHIKPLRTTLSDSVFTDEFSFKAAFKTTGNESRLIVGSYEQKEAKALIQFSTFPDSISQVLGTPKLRLVLNRKLSTSPMSLHFSKVVQNWSESQASWTHAYTDTTWSANAFISSGIPDYSNVPDSIHAGGDTLFVEIPASSILNWQTAHVNGYSLLISTEQQNYLEIKSLESAYLPELVFSYKRTASDTTTYTYDRYAANDTFILQDNETQQVSNSLILKNIAPNRCFVKFNVPRSLFRYNDTDSTVLANDDFKRMTINKAELVLKVKSNPYYGSSSAIMATVYRVKTAVSHEVISDDDMEFITYTPVTTATPGAGTVAFNMTPVLQAFTSGVKENFGMIIRLTTENQDYAKLEFYGSDDPDVSKRPTINVIYTPPAFE
ncbi:MAG TPA: hypothetical protein PLE74_10880 [Candidatus Cloacimonadota bacterium]|nr:hypothetical protein [Candidatus Cloacimonadota bacterium]HPT72772.1 hypothetical protein [Candidatus Cloacimonadota bacterium]